MRAGIMQPYFFPYLGYFQLIGALDLFIVHDNVKYTKKGWINRNRILRDGSDAVITVPLKSASDALDIRDREVASDFRRDKLLNTIRECYRRAPCFAQAYPLIDRVVRYAEPNLFDFLYHSIVETCRYLGLATPMPRSSEYGLDAALRGQDRVIALCKAAGASAYVNPIGGIELYSKEAFRANGLELRFLRSCAFPYPQFGDTFVPSLSIIDVIMFNPVEVVRARIDTGYELL